MGVPCLTLAGGCHAHNVGVSLLHAVGLQDGWIARTQQEYLELAVAAAQDPKVWPVILAFRIGLTDVQYWWMAGCFAGVVCSVE